MGDLHRRIDSEFRSFDHCESMWEKYLLQARLAISNTDAAADNNPAQQRLNIRLPDGLANQRRMCRPM
ncbi:hypothetical protein D3C76_1304040 [compost metagenome]